MKTPKYVLAKYVPDLDRMEPRNIGVIVWSPEGIEARFVAERSDQPATLDGRSIPSFVTSSVAYRQWIEFWRGELQKPEIQTPDGRSVPQGSPDFLAALQTWSRGNFLLAEAGALLDPVDADDLPNVVDHLYHALVETGRSDEPRDPSLDELCDRLLEETRLANNPHFVNRHQITCQVAPGTAETFEFSHAYKNGSLQRLYQRVPFPPGKRRLRKTVHDSAWMLEKVVQSELISRDHTAAIVYVTDDQQTDPAVTEACHVLASVSRVLNLNQEISVRDEFASLASVPAAQ